jgi:hypothetical protein
LATVALALFYADDVGVGVGIGIEGGESIPIPIPTPMRKGSGKQPKDALKPVSKLPAYLA